MKVKYIFLIVLFSIYLMSIIIHLLIIICGDLFVYRSQYMMVNYGSITILYISS